MSTAPAGGGSGVAPDVVEELGRRGLHDVTLVGRGGHAVVYRAEQAAFGRVVAVKLLTGTDLDADAFERFERERRALGSMSGHPNILTVYEAGVTRAGQAFLVTEYAPRGTLAERLARRGPVPWPEAVQVGIKLAGALETAHRRGVVHRDVKPENVLVSDYGEPLLGDFGIARVTGGYVTSTSIIQASVAHVPPEVLTGEAPQPVADVYSLASTVMTLVRGRPPFHEDEAGDAIGPLYARIATSAPPDLRRRGVPDSVCRVLEHGLAKQPWHRPPTAFAFGEELREAQRSLGQAVLPLPVVAPDEDVPVPTEPAAPDSQPVRIGGRGTGPVRRRRRRRPLVLAVVGTLVAAGAVAAVLSRQGGGGNGLDVPLDGLAVGQDRIWVVGGSGEDGGRLVAVDAGSGEVVDGDLPADVLAVASDGAATWALLPDGADPVPGEGAGARPVHPVDGRPVAIEVDGGSVWVLHDVDGQLLLSEFDAGGGAEARRRAVGPPRDTDDGVAPGAALAVRDGDAFASDGDDLVVRNVSVGGSDLTSVAGLGTEVRDLALDETRLWAATGDGRVVGLDLDDATTAGRPVADEPLVEVVAGAGNVWVAGESGALWRLDAERGGDPERIDLPPGPKVLALGPLGELVVVNVDEGTLDRIPPGGTEANPEGRIDLATALDE